MGSVCQQQVQRFSRNPKKNLITHAATPE